MSDGKPVTSWQDKSSTSAQVELPSSSGRPGKWHENGGPPLSVLCIDIHSVSLQETLHDDFMSLHYRSAQWGKAMLAIGDVDLGVVALQQTFVHSAQCRTPQDALSSLIPEIDFDMAVVKKTVDHRYCVGYGKRSSRPYALLVTRPKDKNREINRHGQHQLPEGIAGGI
jgi:hypothetical protein